MAYKKHWLVQFGGTIGLPARDIWTCGIRIGLQNGGDAFDPSEGYLEDTAAPAVAAWFSSGDAQIAPATALTFIKCNEIAPNGDYADQTKTNVYNYPAGYTGNGPSQYGLPFNCAVVLTWRTDVAARGPASRGRIYSPHPSVEVDQATGLFTSANANRMANAAVALLNSLDDSVALGQVRPMICSSIGAGYNHEINAVEVDNVVDTMRKRSNALVGTRISKPFDY